MKVTTINGEEILKKDARKIKREDGTYGYFKIGNPEIKDSGDCYQINNIFYTLEKKRIVWDHYLKKYVLKSSTIEGIIDKNFKVGSFNNEAPVVHIYINEIKSALCMSRDIPQELNYIEGPGNCFYNPDYFTYSQIFPRRAIDSNLKNLLPYNFKTLQEQASENYKSFKIKNDEECNLLYQIAPHLFDKYTFGIELETTRGLIPMSVYRNLGVMPVRDGSISGLEYVTIPLNGKKGVAAFKEIIESIIKYTDSNYTCSMHVHVGGIPRTMEFIVAMFKFGYYFQENIFQLFPSYKRVNDGIKKQCYTAPLDSLLMASLNFKSTGIEKIKEDYQSIVYALSGNHVDFEKFVELDKIQAHPSDPQESAKWYMKERYKWLNIIPLIFTNKKTIEYRIFTVPDNFEKAFLFLLISLVITDFVNNYTSKILTTPSVSKNINLYTISNYTNTASIFKDMLNQRLIEVSKQSNNKGSFFEEEQIKLSKNISFLKKKEKSLTDLLFRNNGRSV